MAKRLKALRDQRVRHWRGRYKVDYGMLKIGLGKRPSMNVLKGKTYNISDQISGETTGITDIGIMPHSFAILKAINELYDEKRQYVGSPVKGSKINRSLRGRIDPVMYWLGIG